MYNNNEMLEIFADRLAEAKEKLKESEKYQDKDCENYYKGAVNFIYYCAADFCITSAELNDFLDKQKKNWGKSL
jgi:hypothetical protein